MCRRLLLILVCVFAAAAIVCGDEPSNIAPNGSFEEALERLGGWLPVGIVPESGPHGIEIVENKARTGNRCLRLIPGPVGMVSGTNYFADYNGGEGKRQARAEGGVRGARTFAMRLDRDLESLVASAWVRRPGASNVTLSAVWTTRRQRRPVVEFHRDTVSRSERKEAGWDLFELRVTVPPDAHQVQLWIETDAVKPVYVDDAFLALQRRPRQQLLVNQLGYETQSRTKRVVLQSSLPLGNVAEANVVDLRTSQHVFTTPWVPKGYLPSWDQYHWVADFSELRRPGRYVVSIGDGDDVVTSVPFAIGENLLDQHAAESAYRFYYYQRCGTEVPGFHAACHLDDAKLADGTWKDLTGGWHDAGDYNKYNGLTPEAVRALVFAYHCKPELFDRWDRDGNGRADILDEAWWGAKFMEKMLDTDSLDLLEAVYSGYRYWGPPEKETDNRPHTGDERPVRPGKGDTTHCVAGFALLGKYLSEDRGKSPDAVDAGRKYLEIAGRMVDKSGGGIERLVPLYQATGDDRYRQAARQQAAELISQQGGPSVVGFRELAFFAIAFPDDPMVKRIRPLATKRTAELQEMCDERFGVLQVKDAAGGLNYCKSYADVNDWYVGETSHRLDGAIDGLLASKLGDPIGRAIAENQVHWLLGRNPLGISMVEGIGARFLPHYHHRYNAIAGNERGAVPGALINGFIRAWPAVDRPWLDLHPEPNADYHCNEPWLLHNNRWMILLALW